MKDDNVEYIKQMNELMPQLNHASNILTKISKPLNEELIALEQIIAEYCKYLKNMLAIKTYDKESIFKKTVCLNRYFDFIHNNGYDNLFSSQGKFRPTILEEFLFLLFKDYVEDMRAKYDDVDDPHLASGNVKAYSNLYFTAKDFKHFIQGPEIGVNQKDQDYAIYRTFSISINGDEPQQIQIPAVAIEAKTYIDKTMLDSIIATAEKLKTGNPHTRFIAVAERYDVSFSVDPAYSRIDQIYILRGNMKKKEWKPISADVVYKMFQETVQHLQNPWSDIETRLNTTGVIL